MAPLSPPPRLECSLPLVPPGYLLAARLQLAGRHLVDCFNGRHFRREARDDDDVLVETLTC